MKLGDRLVARSVAFERSNYQSRGCGIDDGASRTFLRLVSDAHTAAETRGGRRLGANDETAAKNIPLAYASARVLGAVAAFARFAAPRRARD